MKSSRTDWREVKLGMILRYLDERVSLDDEREYLTITVKRRHGGLEIREKLFGHQIATKKQFRLVPGAFIISRVQCWHQAYAIVGDVPPNTIASANYDQFAISAEVDPRFFWWLSHSPAFTETVRSSAVGVVIEKMVFNRDEWLTKSVHLPPLQEQRRLVAHIEKLAGQIREARTLQEQIEDDVVALCRAIIRDGATTPTPMRELMALRPPEIAVQKDQTYQFAGVYSFGRGVFKGARKSGSDFAYPRLSRLRTGDFVYPKLMAWEGAFGVTPPECDGCVVSTEFPVFEVNRERVLPEVLDVHFRDPSVWETVAGRSIGTNARRRRLNPADLLEYRFPLPSHKAQQKLATVCVESGMLKRLQAETAAELDALLPAILDRAFKGELLPPERIEVSSPRPPALRPLHSFSREFIRGVFAAEIVDRMRGDPSFGQTKLQKICFLAEYRARVVELETRPTRHPRGPHDPAFIREAEDQMHSKEWFREVPRAGGKGHAYLPLARAGEQRAPFEHFWPEQAAAIRQITQQFLTWKTDDCERLATLYAAWNDLLLWKLEPTDTAILDQVLKHWNPAKLRFTRAEWQQTLAWMRRHDFAPTGFGHPTAAAPQPELF